MLQAAAAQSIRLILIDHARAKLAQKRSPASPESATPPRSAPSIPADLAAVTDIGSLAQSDPETIVAVDAALSRLEAEDPEAAAVVRLRFFAGLSVEQAALALGLSPRTAARLWSFARATLHRSLSHIPPSGE